jgi:predicted metalloprotease with PDZ domain
VTIRFEFSVEDVHTHRAQIRMEVPEVSGSTLDLVLPVWMPGSYSIIETSRNVRDVRAVAGGSGRSLDIHRVDKTRWRVATDGSSSVEVRFAVYGHQLDDSCLDITSEHFFLNAGFCFPYVDGRTQEPYEVAIHAPSGWKAFTELEEIGKSPQRFRARDYDELVDEPIDVGTPVELRIHPNGIPHRILLCGPKGSYEPHRLEEDLARIVEAAIRIFGDSPLSHYTFFYHLVGPGSARYGGLEHRKSTSIVLPRQFFRPAEAYYRFLAVSAHEYFHLYNVKRIRPRVLGPFDYTRENYTRLLWAMEGSTDYFTGIILRRANLVTVPKYLERLGKLIRRYTNTPGRKVASLEELSTNAWIDLYRPYEETANQSVSYYVKGALVTLCLDLEIRSRTENRSSVEAVFRTLWEEYGRPDRGLEEDEILTVANRVSGLDLGPFFRKYVSGTDEIDFGAFLGHAGLRLVPQEKPPGHEEDPIPGYLGAEFADEGGRGKITVVLEDGPARRAGLSPQDEIVALDGEKVLFRDFPKICEKFPPGSEVEVTVFRRGVLTTVPVTTGKGPPERLVLTPRDDASDLARRIYESWLAEKWPPTGKKDSGTGTATAS